MSMAKIEYTPHKGYILDKLRHNDPKTAKRLEGVGDRKKQYDVLVKEGKLQTATEATNKKKSTMWRDRMGMKQVSYTVTPEESEKWGRLRSGGTSRDLLVKMMDTYEKSLSGDVASATAPQQGISQDAINRLKSLCLSEKKNIDEMVSLLCDRWEKGDGRTDSNFSGQSAAVMAIVRDWQEKLKIQDATVAMRRICEMAEKSEARARAVIRLQQQIDKMNEEALTHSIPITAANANVSVTVTATDEVTNTLFEFVDAFKGSTATASAMGEVVVSTPPEGMATLFSVWQKAVKVLGISKRGS